MTEQRDFETRLGHALADYAGRADRDFDAWEVAHSVTQPTSIVAIRASSRWAVGRVRLGYAPLLVLLTLLVLALLATLAFIGARLPEGLPPPNPAAVASCDWGDSMARAGLAPGRMIELSRDGNTITLFDDGLLVSEREGNGSRAGGSGMTAVRLSPIGVGLVMGAIEESGAFDLCVEPKYVDLPWHRLTVRWPDGTVSATYWGDGAPGTFAGVNAMPRERVEALSDLVAQLEQPEEVLPPEALIDAASDEYDPSSDPLGSTHAPPQPLLSPSPRPIPVPGDLGPLEPCAFVPFDGRRPTDDELTQNGPMTFGPEFRHCTFRISADDYWDTGVAKLAIHRDTIAAARARELALELLGPDAVERMIDGRAVWQNSCLLGKNESCAPAIAVSAEPYFVVVVFRSPEELVNYTSRGRLEVADELAFALVGVLNGS